MIKPKIVLFDLDSTLSDSQARFERFEREFGGRDYIDWVAYALACEEDPPTQTLALVKVLSDLGMAVGGVSFRPEAAREATLRWTAKHGIFFSVLKLLQQADSADHHTVPFKTQAVREVLQDWDVVLFVEDQHRIARAVQSELGVPSMVVSSYAPSEREMSF